MSRGNEAPSSGQYIRSLTGLRFFAALHVVLLHLLAAHHLDGLPDFLRRVVDQANVAVDLFFILSGFILTYTYLGLDGRSVSGGRQRFWVARVARVYPVYAVGLLLAIPLLGPAFANLSPLATAATLVSVPLLVQGWSPDLVTLWNPPAWSLSTEAFFYLLFPALIPWLARLTGRLLLVVAALVYVAGLIAPTVYVLANQTGAEANWWLRLVIFAPLFHLPEFVLGVIGGLVFVRQSRTGRVLRPRLRIVAGVAALAGAVGYVLAAWSGEDLPRVFVGNGLFAPVFALLVYALAVEPRGLGWLLSLPLVVLLGEASYALYLLHVPVVWWVDRAAHLLPDGGAWLFGRRWFALLDLGLAVGMSIGAFWFIERPGRRAIRRLLDPSRRARLAPTGIDRQGRAVGAYVGSLEH